MVASLVPAFLDWSRLPLHGFIIPLFVLFVILPLWGAFQYFRGPE